MAYTKMVKDVDAVLDYRWNWSAELVGGDTLTDAVFTITATDGGDIPDTDTTPVVVDSYSYTTTAATAWLSGGTLGTSYLIVCHVVTAGGREDDKTLQLKITQK